MKMRSGSLFIAAILLNMGNLCAQISKAPSSLLGVGDAAPELKIEQWLKGGGYDQLEKDKIYVVDLWAVWCVPCIASMPHLSRLQEKYKSAGLEVIGITSLDKYGNSLENIQKFVKQRDSIMKYQVALVPVSMNKDSVQGIFEHPWLQQIGSSNMPTAFLIDRNGKFAFIGDPLTIDETLDEVMSNNYELSSLKSIYQEELKASKVLERFTAALEAKNIQKAIIEGNKILDSFTHVKPVTYLVIADAVPKIKGTPNAKLLNIALTAGKRAVVLTRFESPGFLSALASVYAAKADYVQAVITIKAAISVSDGGMKEAQVKEMENYISRIQKR